MEKLPKDILDQLTPNEKNKYVLYYNAITKNIQRYNDEPTIANDNNLKASEQNLGELTAELLQKYGDPSTIQCVDWTTYKETKVKSEVLRYLTQAGWEIKRQTFYNHCNDGKLRVNRQGVYSRQMVKKYAEGNLVHSSVGVKKEEHEINLATKKTIKEIDRISTAEEHERFKLDILRGKYILRSEVYRELAARGVVLNSGLEYVFQAHIVEMIAMVGGDQQRAPELLAFLLEKKDEQLNQFANMGEFTVALNIEREEALP